MVAFSRHILTIALFLLLQKLGCLFSKTFNGGFRYEKFAFSAKKQLGSVNLWLLSAENLGDL